MEVNLFMNERLENIRQEISDGVKSLTNSKEVYEFKKKYMDSKAGKIGQLMKEMKNIPPEERAAFGKGVNELKEWALNKFGEIDSKMKELELKIKYKSEKIDVTMPAKKIETGNLHPITQMKNELIDVFAGMGFEIYEGTEIENDYYNFTALNTPRIIRQGICRIHFIFHLNSF